MASSAFVGHRFHCLGTPTSVEVAEAAEVAPRTFTAPGAKEPFDNKFIERMASIRGCTLAEMNES